MTNFDPNVVPVEWTGAAYEALARRRVGPLVSVLNNKAIIEIAGDVTAVIGAIWPLVVAEVEKAEVCGCHEPGAVGVGHAVP